MTKPIITSFLDQDSYKISMAQVVWAKHPDAVVTYDYKCRTPVDLSYLAPQIRAQFDALGDLRITERELEYLGNIRYLKHGFLSFLKRFQLDPKHVKIETNPFRITVEGPWADTIFWEIFILSIVSEVYYQDLAKNGEVDKESALREADAALTKKIELIRAFEQEGNGLNFRLIEFGTRRRFSGNWQEHVFTRLLNEVPNSVFGTSNMKLAQTYNTRVIGTMAHEYLQAFQAFVRLRDSQKVALQTWADVYRGDLGIALTDVICMDAFLRDFDLYFAKLFDGLRHDSGDPIIWGEKAIAHYKKLGIDPKTKALVFSDGLDIKKAINLCRLFEYRIKTSFGIGTHLTCDIPEIVALNHVLKMALCNGQDVAKLSDSPGKGMCRNDNFVEYLKSVFGYNL